MTYSFGQANAWLMSLNNTIKTTFSDAPLVLLLAIENTLYLVPSPRAKKAQTSRLTKWAQLTFG